MDLKTYQAAKIQSFFNLGLKFSVTGDQLAVAGFNQYPPDDRAGLQESIRMNKSKIMEKVIWLQDRLIELIRMADNSKEVTADQMTAISAEGTEIIDQLPEETVQQIFKN